MLQPRALLLDEPTAALDAKSARRLLSALRELRASTGITLVMITHRIEDAAEHADHLVVLAGGRVAEQGAARAVLQSPQSAALRELLAEGDDAAAD
jgi:ABC-type glutathione transport system ATPase component